LARQEFARHLYNLMMKRGWNQSELARQADLPRDSISAYVRGISLPNPQNLGKLADALGVDSRELLPTNADNKPDADSSTLELRISAADPSKAWLKVERFVSAHTASKIVEMIAADDAAMKPSEEDGAATKKKTLFDLLAQNEPEADFEFEPPRLSDDMGLRIPSFDED
jgi:transcriptional regulator with XRE-family HTH domain